MYTYYNMIIDMTIVCYYDFCYHLCYYSYQCSCYYHYWYDDYHRHYLYLTGRLPELRGGRRDRAGEGVDLRGADLDRAVFFFCLSICSLLFLIIINIICTVDLSFNVGLFRIILCMF